MVDTVDVPYLEILEFQSTWVGQHHKQQDLIKEEMNRELKLLQKEEDRIQEERLRVQNRYSAKLANVLGPLNTPEIIDEWDQLISTAHHLFKYRDKIILPSWHTLVNVLQSKDYPYRFPSSIPFRDVVLNRIRTDLHILSRVDVFLEWKSIMGVTDRINFDGVNVFICRYTTNPELDGSVKIDDASEWGKHLHITQPSEYSIRFDDSKQLFITTKVDGYILEKQQPNTKDTH